MIATKLKNLQECLADLTAKETCEILINEFNLQHATLFLKQKKITLVEVYTMIHETSLLASEVGPLTFWGGPPSYNIQAFTGSLLTFLLDRVLYANWLNGSYADLVGIQ